MLRSRGGKLPHWRLLELNDFKSPGFITPPPGMYEFLAAWLGVMGGVLDPRDCRMDMDCRCKQGIVNGDSPIRLEVITST